MLVVEQNANLALDIGHRGLRARDRPDRRPAAPPRSSRRDEDVRKAYLGF